MSRRPPNPAAERAAQNQQTIKSLLKLEANKVCADCKRNKHPRWASWNLGVFVCIRCSGIHRGMGTHISRVKSVDLDAWTDEQLPSILSWGNARANKYWESKLAQGHVPSEAKIENFIRTKYELKRWVMDGEIPDPSTLDVEGDDDVPLSIVKEKQTVDRKESIRKASLGKSAAPQADLIGGDPVPQRASTAGPPTTKVAAKSEVAPPKATSTKDSLLGLDFLGTDQAAPPRPSSTTSASTVGGQSRPDLKQSILSLYATAPRPQAQSQPVSQGVTGSFGGMPSPPLQQQSQSSSGFVDAFSSLSFGTGSTAKSPQASTFSSLGNPSSNRSTPPTNTVSSSAFTNLSGGSFFDPKPAPSQPSHQQKQSFGSGSSFSAFASPTTTAAAPKPAAAPSSSDLNNLFDFSTPPQPAPPQPSNPPAAVNSVFNLSSSQAKPTPAATAGGTAPLGGSSSAAWSSSDVWGNNAWGTPEPAAAAAPKISEAPKASTLGSTNDFGWGSGGGSLASKSIVPGAGGSFSPTPNVAADEEFGGWTSGGGGGTTSGTGTGTNTTAKPSGGFGNDDVFSNVWQ